MREGGGRTDDVPGRGLENAQHGPDGNPKVREVGVNHRLLRQDGFLLIGNHNATILVAVPEGEGIL